jgi:hypothetical protein
MTKQLIKEAKRLQELAGINEVKIKPSPLDIASFLNRHDDEVEEKIIYPNIKHYEIKGKTTYDEWERVNPYEYSSPGVLYKPDNEVNIAQSTINGEYGSIGINVSFEPFDENYIEDADYSNTHPITIGNRTVYVNTYDF